MQTADEHNPWQLTTPSGRGNLVAWVDDNADLPAIVCQVGQTELRYHRSCLDDLHQMLVERGDWMALGSKDEKQDVTPDTVEAWARSPKNPVGGWYGLKKGFRGRFANYIPPILQLQGKVEFEKRGRSMWVRAVAG